MNSRTSSFRQVHRSGTHSRSSLSPIRAVRLTGSSPTTTVSNDPLPNVASTFSEADFIAAHRTTRWPAWHRGALDRLQAPLTRIRE